MKLFGYFYPRSPCGERPRIHSTSGGHPGISIHALLAESDPRQGVHCRRGPYFYPRSPCGERQVTFWQDIDDREFLSTLSLRRATHSYAEFMTWGAFLSTLSLRRATYNCTPHNRLSQFLSTLSLRRATRLGLLGWLRVLISIHALLAESDGISSIRIIGFLEFLSTLSLRRATNGHETSPYRAVISIHALLAESDPAKSESLTTYLISIHALHAESDLHYLIPNSGTLHFYPRSPCGERLHCL